MMVESKTALADKTMKLTELLTELCSTPDEAFKVLGHEVLTKYRSGDAGDLYSRQLEDDLVEVMGQAEAAYAEQLTDIGKMLVRAGVLTEEAIGRQGVRFAVRDRFELLAEAKPKKTKSKKAARRS